ncbi:MAG: Kelch repeat-containing protein [Kofleriaceae bacterium]
MTCKDARRFMIELASPVLAAIATIACSDPPETVRNEWQPILALPEPVSNNAVAAVETPEGCALVTALGIDASRASAGIHVRAWMFDDGWQPLPDVGGPPRIAASAVTLRGKVYVIGGYSVAASGAETTHPNVEILDLATRTWAVGPPLPTAIDDAVVVTWRDRWIVVVSGWSNSAPISTVQLFDVEVGTWTTATAFPGTPVFGHAGAIVDDELVIVDGVRSNVGGFAIERQAWIGRLDPSAPTTIGWTQLPDHPGPARYRAAGGTAEGHVIIHGGTAEPYNFDGLSYLDDTPARPLADAIVFDPIARTWLESPIMKPVGTMDHRALVGCGPRLFTIGGMEVGPVVTDAVWSLEL